MSASTQYIDPTGFATLGPLGGALQAGLLAGVAGLGVAIALRRHGWRWTWSALLAGVSFAGSRMGIPAAGTLTVTFGLAAAVGRRWQRADLQAGGDFALRAQGTFGLTDMARHAAARRRIRTGRWYAGRELMIGLDSRGSVVEIPVGDESGLHTLVVGATGSGKTVTQTWLVVRAIERGHGAVVVDPKGDLSLRAALVAAAARQGREFVEWTPEGPSVYNPYAHGSDTEIADKSLSTEQYTEPHYLRQAQRYLGHVVRTMRGAQVTISPASLLRYMDPAALEALGRELPESKARELWSYLDGLTARQVTDLAGTRDRLAIAVESDVGRWLDPEASAGPAFDLVEAIDRRAVVYYRLDADRRALLARMLGAGIVGDLLTAAAVHQGDPRPTIVMIDEFSALGAAQVASLFARTRSAGMSMVLGTQELSDLRVDGRDTVLDGVLGNVACLIAHRQIVPRSAELAAAIGGTRGAWATSQQTQAASLTQASSRGGTRTRTRSPLIRPDEIQSLACGWAAVIVPGGGGGARVAQVLRVGS